MMTFPLRRIFRGRYRAANERGQSLLETAIAIPLLLGLAFNVINLAYFWYMVLVLSSSPRMAVQYATQGGEAIQKISAPQPGPLSTASSVSYIASQNMVNEVVGASTSNVSVQVCSSSIGVDSKTHIAKCTQYGPSFSYSATAADPEAPVYVLDRVDVAYTVKPIIPGTIFNVVLPSNLTFHRQVSMRSLY